MSSGGHYIPRIKKRTIGEILLGREEHEKQMRRVAWADEDEFIRKFAKKWNFNLTKYTGDVPGGGVRLIGWINLEHMFRVFLRAYKWRQK